MAESKTSISIHKLRVLLAIVLIILTVQGWFGDTTNLFITTGTAPAIAFSFGAIISQIENYGPILISHALVGLILLILSIVTLALSFGWTKKRSIRILSILACLFVISAVYGGVSFVNSGFTDLGSSAQMGGSFIGAYAFYWMELYFTR
jgi:uncharacterized membrane protein YozB (DUF420 family)